MNNEYAPCCCGEDCTYRDDEKECWGQVEPVDEVYTEDDWWFIHACKGHVEYWCDGEYISRPGERN